MEVNRRLTTIDPKAAQQIQPELFSGDSILWAAMPNPNIVFHSDDWAIVPFSIVWLGFFVFWEAEALGWTGNHSDWFSQLWGSPFLTVGNYMLWGRFFWDAWIKRRTYYAITSRRVILLQQGWKKKASSLFLREIPSISAEGTETGTLWIGPKYPILGSRGQKKRSLSRFDLGDVPVLADIDNVDAVHRLLVDLGAKR